MSLCLSVAALVHHRPVDGSVLDSLQHLQAEQATLQSELQELQSSMTAAATHLQVALAAAAPYGSIVLWHGSEKDIPTGWVACDGHHGTPDLRDRFVVGAGSRYPVGNDTAKGLQVGASYTLDPMRRGANTANKAMVLRDLKIDFGEPVLAHHALVYIMRIDQRCCVCHCSMREPTRPVYVNLEGGQAPDAACDAKCKDKSACGVARGSFAHKFC